MIENNRVKKISLEQVEVIDKAGHVIKESDHSLEQENSGPRVMGNIHVMKAGPLGFLILPLLIPVFLIGFILLLVFALFFGKTVFKVITNPFQRKTN